MRKGIWPALAVLLLLSLAGCSAGEKHAGQKGNHAGGADTEAGTGQSVIQVEPSEEIAELEEGFSVVRYDGDYGFDKFLLKGGASSDKEVARFLAENLLQGMDFGFMGNIFGCSTVAVQAPDGTSLFGRNFDWDRCEALAVVSHPENGYASVSTVNMDFISQGAGGGVAGAVLKMDEVKTIAALYAPLDGMNEKGLAVSVNMIQDSDSIGQDTEKPDITTTTAVRLLLDQAATVEEALKLLGKYDLHASMGMMVHFAVADVYGNSVAVEYVDNEMVITETPVLTNFYLAEGEKHGIGTEQSHTRYEMLMERLEQSRQMGMDDVRDALGSVSKGNFGEFESTEWSIVFDQTAGRAVYYHRENYGQGYAIKIE